LIGRRFLQGERGTDRRSPIAAERLLLWLERRLELLVQERWPQIHAVAFELLDKRSLTGEQVHAILR